MLFMQKERNISEYINFITYQDDAIYQRPLRYYRRRGQPHPQPKGDLHQGNRHRGTYHDDHLSMDLRRAAVKRYHLSW